MSEEAAIPPERPEDFSDEEYQELCEIQSRAPKGVKANPEYIRVGRRFITVTISPFGVTYSPDIR